MKENVFKGVFAAASAALVAYAGKIIIPLIVLVAIIVLDYITGMVKAYMTAEISSRIGVIGIIKKLCYLIVGCAGVGVDWVISSVCSTIGIDYRLPFMVALILIFWLVINELISILENLAVIGVPMPTFLTKIVKRLKIAVESRLEEKESEAEENEDIH